MPWYDEWFGSDAYNLVYAHRDEAEAERLIDLVEREVDPAPDAHILDVGCGRGRHARILARRGYDVTGIDLSASSIVEAREWAAQDGLDITFVQGDMREPYCEGCADGVVNLFTSFGYFETDAKNRRALHAMATALPPDGWLLQDYLNAPQVRATLEPESVDTVDGVTIRQRRWIEDSRINKKITLEWNDTKDTFHESVRLYTREDLEEMYEAAGLTPVGAFGTYDGDAHAAESPRLLLHARRSPG